MKTQQSWYQTLRLAGLNPSVSSSVSYMLEKYQSGTPEKFAKLANHLRLLGAELPEEIAKLQAENAELETKLEKLTKASQDVVDSYNEEKKTGSVSKLKALSKLLATYTST